MLKKDDWLTCKKCGKAIRWDEAFCSACGSKVELEDGASIELPALGESVGKLELWGRTTKLNPSVETKKNDPSPKVSFSQENERVEKKLPLKFGSKVESKGEQKIETKEEPKVESKAVQEVEAKDKPRGETEAEQKIKQVESKDEQKVDVEFFDERWSESWLEFYHNSPIRAIGLLASVLVETLMFFPYALVVLYVFQYNLFCTILTISSAVVLLTHGVCVCASYYSIFTKTSGVNKIDEISKAVEKTQNLLKWGVAFMSAFLLAFFICLICNNAAEAQPEPAADYVPVSFDD